MILAAAGTIVYNQWAKHQKLSIVRQQVLPDLKPAARIELQTAALKDWNVLLISIDTTRANHLNCYGYPYTKTPVLNDLARHGVLYSHAYTPSPATLPGHSSLLTGLYPLHHGARANGTFKLKEENLTLAEILRQAGYRTGAAISAFVLDSRFGTDQGFEVYDDDLTVGMKYSPHMFRERAAELTNVPVTRWLREYGREKFFFWVHYFDPHAPYTPPEPYRTEYAKGPYDGEIDYADEQTGKLLQVLDEMGIRDRTLIIVVSDHGEGLGQHGEQTHSLLIYDSTLHVPMIFSAAPPFPQGQVIHGQVCLTDVMPTVLDLLGVTIPDNLDGISLLRDVPNLRPAICIETLCTMVLHGWAPLIGIRQEDFKFILAPQKELYDFRKDPLEETNIHDQKPRLAQEFYNKLVSLVGTHDPYLATTFQQDLTLDNETRKRLESLGYVFSASAQDKRPENLPDPKEMVYHWEDLQHGVHLKLAGKVKEGLKIIEECVKKVPCDIYARQNLASTYALIGQIDKAIEALKPALELQPDNTGLIVALASLQLNKMQFKPAEEALQKILDIEPENTEALIGIARITYYKGKADEAREMFEKVIEIDPGSSGPVAYNEIGMIHLRAGRYDQARQAYQEALKIDGLNGPAHDGLANVLLAENNHDQAMRHLQLALRFNPLQLRAMATLGALYREKGALKVAEAWCRRVLDINPNFAMALNNLGLIYRHQDEMDQAEESYRQAIAAAPRMAIPYINLAQLLLKKGDESGAGVQFLAAAKVNPNNVLALTNLATFYYRQKQLARAARLYRRAVKLKPDYALVHKYLGLIYASVDRPRAGIHHLELALEHDPNDPEAQGLRQVIAEMEKLTQKRPEPEPPFPEDTATDSLEDQLGLIQPTGSPEPNIPANSP